MHRAQELGSLVLATLVAGCMGPLDPAGDEIDWQGEERWEDETTPDTVPAYAEDDLDKGDAFKASWTGWYDRDNPSGNGDWELRSLQAGVCASPTAVDCRTTSGLYLWQTGELVSCSASDGLLCLNADQPDGYCNYDYKVRFLCPSGCSGSSNQVPSMTSSTSPSGIVTRSGVYSSSYEGWKAFDSSTGSMWLSQTWQSPAWLAYQWTDGPRTISSYAITFTNGSLTTRAPRDWTFQGWNGSTWVTLDTRTNQTSWAGTETRTYSIGNPGSYSKYRLHITRDNDSRADIVVVSIGRLALNGC